MFSTLVGEPLDFVCEWLKHLQAPEVFLNLPYNEKADIFSVGVVLYELFSASMIADVVLEERTWAEAKEFASKVAHGHRIRLNALPREIATLIKMCWQQVRSLKSSACFAHSDLPQNLI